MRLLSLEKSMRAAITLVTKLKLPFLAEKFCSILEVLLCKDLLAIRIFGTKERQKVQPQILMLMMLTYGFSLTGKVARRS